MISRDEALKRVKEHVKNRNLVKHMIAVSAIMGGLAEYLEDDRELWEIVGILHDIDYEKVGEDWERHGVVSAEMVADDLPKDAVHAISAHNPRTGYKPESPMDVALLAADALSGLIVATALMMPDKKVATVKVRSLRRKLRDRSFARGVNRENLARCEKLGLNLDEFLAIGLESMQSVSDELGL